MKLSPNELARMCSANVAGTPRMDLDEARTIFARIDSRLVEKGDLFVCLMGEKADGHDYAPAACGRGASFILATRDLPEVREAFPNVCLLVAEDPEKSLQMLAKELRARMRGKVVGVTGTAGKTTLKEWLFASLSLAGKAARTKGNFNNQLGLPLSIANTDGDEDFWVIEAGISRPGDMEELAEILVPDLGIVLNVGTGHTEGLGEKGVAFHKTRMFGYLAQGGMAVASADYPDLWARTREICEASRKQAFFFSTAKDGREVEEKKANPLIHAIACQDGHEAGCVRLYLRGGGKGDATFGEWRLTLPVQGPAAMENTACAGLVLHLLGLDPALLEKGAANTHLPGHRFAKREVGGHMLVDDCYNANPLSMARMVEAAHAEAVSRGARFVAVLGAMLELGEDAASAHEALGRQLAEMRCAHVFWKGENSGDVARGLHGAAPFESFSSDEDFSRLFDAFLEGMKAQDTQPAPPLAVLFKGSRSNRLETLIPVVEDRLARGCGNAPEGQDPKNGRESAQQ